MVILGIISTPFLGLYLRDYGPFSARAWTEADKIYLLRCANGDPTLVPEIQRFIDSHKTISPGALEDEGVLLRETVNAAEDDTLLQESGLN